MGVFDDVFDFFFGWLIPDQEYMGGTELNFLKPSEEPVVYGHVTGVNGVVVASYISDPNDGDDIPNDLLYLQVVWSVGNIEDVIQIYLDDKPINSSNFTDSNNGSWVQYWNYTEGEDVTVVGKNISFESKGYSYSVIRLEYDPEKMNHLPIITADLKGIKVTPVDGGAKVYSDNYADILNDYITNPDYGRGLSGSRLNQAALISEKNFSKTMYTPYVGGLTQPLMSCNLRLDGNNTLLSNVNKILQGCRGFLPYFDGQFHFIIERDRDALVGFEVTDSNRISDFIIEDVEIKDYYNKVTVRYADRNQQGKLDNAVYPVNDVEYQAYLTADGGMPYEKTVTISAINNKYEALQMAEIILKRSRNALKVKVSVTSDAKVTGVGQVINASNTGFGMVQKPFLVVNKKTKATGIVDLELLEYQGSIYPWNTKDEQIIPDTIVADYTQVNVPTGLAISFPDDGTAQAVITWESPHNSFITEMDGESSLTGNKSYSLTNLPFGNRTFKVKAINGLGYKSAYASLLFEITVPQVPILTIIPDTFDVQIIPTITGSYLNTTFELKLGLTNVMGNSDDKGLSGTFTLTSLTPETVYYVWVRTVNVAGVSAWATGTFTTLDGQKYASIVDVGIEAIEVEVDELQADVEILNSDTDKLLESVIWNTALHQEKVSDIGHSEVDIKVNEEAVVTETTARVSQGTQLNARVDTTDGVVTGQITRVDLIDLDLDGKSTAISALEGTVNNVTSGVSASYGLVLAAQSDADDNAIAHNSLYNTVHNATTGLSATNTIAQSADNRSGVNATAVTSINSTITDIENLTTTGSALELAVNATSAAFQLTGTVEANGTIRVVGIKGGINGVNSTLDFYGDQVRFLDSAGNPSIYFNTVDNKYYFSGDLSAAGGTFSGDITAASGNFSGDITATGGSIGGFTIDDTNLYSNSKTLSGEYTVEGVWLNSSGSIRTPYFYSDSAGAGFKGDISLATGTITAASIKANNIDGDVTDMLAKTTTSVADIGATEVAILSFTVTDMPFVRNVVVGNLEFTMTPLIGGSLVLRLKVGSTVHDTISTFVPVSSGDVKVVTRPLITSLASGVTQVFTVTAQSATDFCSHTANKVILSAFKDGSTIS